MGDETIESVPSKWARDLNLDRLDEMTMEELDEVFRKASTPTIGELDGPTEGRPLAGRIPADRLPWMPWKGKVFEPVSDSEGRGSNRIESNLFDLIKLRLFEFRTRIVDPMFGDDRVVLLDYDLDDNPALIRRVRDELKRVRDGLFLGRAYLRKQGQPRFVLYFALQLR